MTDKREVIQALDEMATLLELSGANPFKSRAYERGARALDAFTGDLEQMVAEGKVDEIEGIGKRIAQMVTDLVKSGASADLDSLREQVPATMVEMAKIQGLGPKKIILLRKELGIESIPELEQAAREERIRNIKGFGEKSEKEILVGIEALEQFASRFLRPVAEAVAERFVSQLESCSAVERIRVCGSLRRGKETIGDLDLLATTTDFGAVQQAFFETPGLREEVMRGDTKCRALAEEGIGVDLRIVEDDEFAAASHYFTGSKEHNTKLRGMARSRGWKLNEYGLWDENDDKIPCAEEKDIFEKFGLAWIPPELREDRGEIELAERDELPDLVKESDLRGALHVHTTWSDGRHTLETMVEAARSHGWSYLGITDHSRTAAYAGGLSIDDLKRQGEEIRKLNDRYDDFVILHGVESDILPSGDLDYPDEVLAELDFVVASIHSQFNLSRADQTARIEKALRHPATSVLGHATGRVLLRREGYEIDLDHLLEVAVECGVIVEINAHPSRLDLDWRWGKRAREIGLLSGIFPDAHSSEGLDHVRHGVTTARKAGFEAKQIVNTYPLDELREVLNRL